MYISNEDNPYCRLHLLLEKLGKKFKQSHLNLMACTDIMVWEKEKTGEVVTPPPPPITTNCPVSLPATYTTSGYAPRRPIGK